MTEPEALKPTYNIIGLLPLALMVLHWPLILVLGVLQLTWLHRHHHLLPPCHVIIWFDYSVKGWHQETEGLLRHLIEHDISDKGRFSVLIMESDPTPSMWLSVDHCVGCRPLWLFSILSNGKEDLYDLPIPSWVNEHMKECFHKR